jgi:hypothetical protein
MFEQYTDEELYKLDSLKYNPIMAKEARCRQVANEYKDMSDNELLDLISEMHSKVFKAHQRTFGKVHTWSLNTDHLFLELRRRELKRKGVTELPIEIVYSDEEMELQVKIDNEYGMINHLEYLIEEEEASASPDLGKIEEYKMKIVEVDKRIEELEKEQDG